MIIQIDSREKTHIIEGIVRYFDDKKIKHITSKLVVGDYISLDNPKLSIDRKHNLSECANNLTNDAGRFMREVRLARDLGVHMVVLCEHGGWCKSLRDVENWHNPMQGRIPYAISGKELMELMYRVHIAYGVDWFFCDKRSTGRRIVEILSNG